MSEAKDSSIYFGVFLGERILLKFFKHVRQMPFGYQGYDFICDNGYKIDAKCSALRYPKKGNPHWNFCLRKNKVADYFLCLGFDNRRDLNPIHIWLIPGSEINYLDALNIINTNCGLDKWKIFEKSLENIKNECSRLKINPAPRPEEEEGK